MKLRPNGPDARGRLHQDAQFLLGSWRQLCDELAQALADNLTEPVKRPTDHLEVNVCEARNDFATLVAGYGPFVLYFPGAVVTEDGLAMPAGYYTCDIADAQPQVPGSADDPDRGNSYKKPRTIKLWLVLRQPGGQKVNVVLELDNTQLTEIYFTH